MVQYVQGDLNYQASPEMRRNNPKVHSQFSNMKTLSRIHTWNGHFVVSTDYCKYPTYRICTSLTLKKFSSVTNSLSPEPLLAFASCCPSVAPWSKVSRPAWGASYSWFTLSQNIVIAIVIIIIFFPQNINLAFTPFDIKDNALSQVMH